MLRTGDGGDDAIGQQACDPLLGGVLHQPVLDGGDDDDRQHETTDIPVPRHPVRCAQGEVQPPPGRRGQGKVGIGTEQVLCPFVAHRVMSEDIALEGLVDRVTWRLGPVLLVSRHHPVGDDQAGEEGKAQTQHGRTQHRADEAGREAARQGDQGQAATHRVADGDPGRWQAGLEGVEQGGIVRQVGLQAGCMALEPVRQFAMRQPLPSPLVHQNHEASGLEVADHLEILLDGLGATRGQDHRPADPAGRMEERRPEGRSILALEPLRPAIGRYGRIGKFGQGR